MRPNCEEEEEPFLREEQRTPLNRWIGSLISHAAVSAIFMTELILSNFLSEFLLKRLRSLH